MTLRSSVTAAAVLLSMTCASTTAIAADHGWGRRDSGGWILRAIGLTDAQKAQIRQVFVSHRAQLQTLYQQLGAAERGLRERIYSDTNPPKLADLAPISQLRDSLAQERLQMALEIRAVLTPEQLAKGFQLRQQMDQLEAQMRALVTPGP